MKLKIIANGYVNLAKEKLNMIDEDKKKLFESRKKICDMCKFGKTSRCKKCGCLISAKTKSEESSCPIGKW